jgi:hypothetical protein
MISINRERALRGARNTLTSIALALFAFALPATAATYHVAVNGVNLALSQAPFDQGGRVFVPLRAVFEGLNAGVAYDNGTINATSGERTVQVKIGSNQAIVNGQQTFLDAAPFIIGSTTMVPLRFVSEALGATVDYDNTSGSISISQAKVPIANGLAFNTILGTELNTATAYVGQPLTLTVAQPGPAGATALSGATIYGQVLDVQAAHQGVNPSLTIAVNSIKLAGSSAQQPISAKVVRMNPVQGNNFAKEAGGTLGGMLIGNWIGKSLDSNQGGLIGAAGGYLFTSNSKTNLDVASGSSVTLQLTDALALK